MLRQPLDELQARAQSALGKSPIHALRALQIEPVGDALRLRGSLPTFYLKQLAQEAVRSIVGGVELINSIHVREVDETEL